MEEKAHNLEVDESKLKLAIHVKKPKDETLASSSDDNSKRTEDAKEASASPLKKEEEKLESRASTPARSSPEPSCAICLEQLQNKSFTDSCFHMFCFTCLVEWSKVKAECPLCKQRFKSIVHNVRSIEDYDQYYIKSKSSENLWSSFSLGDRRFRYSTTLTAERLIERSRVAYQETIESQIASHRMRYAPHSVRMYSSSEIESRVPCNFRGRIYDQGLWVKPFSGDRVRCISSDFYRQNPGVTHRLLPWLNRELVALLQDNENQVTFVMELIMALITRYEITSQEFFLHIEPYLAPRTSHFIHEFYNFAVSPYDMENYDRQASYSFLNASNLTHIGSSPDSDVIALPSNGNELSLGSQTRVKESLTHGRKTSHTAYKKIVLKRNKENNSWETVPYRYLVSNSYSIPGPSTSGFHTMSSPLNLTTRNIPKPNYPIRTEEIHCSDDDEDECQIIDVVKTKSDKAPEVVLLSSGEEDTTGKEVIDVSSGDESLLNDTRAIYDSPESLLANELDIFDFRSDDECVFLTEQTSLDKAENKKNVIPDGDGHEEPESSDVQVHSFDHKDTTDKNLSEESKKPSLPLIPSAVVIPWSPESRASSMSCSYPKHKRSVSSSKVPDSSADSCSEAERPPEKSSRHKKLKLRSVVAHFSYDHSDERRDTSRRSSHKRHKEKKKKKKKHAHRHKHRIYSDESD